MGGMDSLVHNASFFLLFFLCFSSVGLPVGASDVLATTEGTDGSPVTSPYIVTPSGNATTEGTDGFEVAPSSMLNSSELLEKLLVDASNTTEGTVGFEVAPSAMLSSSEIINELLVGASNATEDGILMDATDINSEEPDESPENGSDSTIISDQPYEHHLGALVVIPFNNETATTTEPHELLESTTPIYELTTAMTTTTEEPEYTRSPVRFSGVEWGLFRRLQRFYCFAGEWCEFSWGHDINKREYALDENGKKVIINTKPEKEYTRLKYSGFLMEPVDSARQIDVSYKNTTIFKLIRVTVQKAIPWRTTHMITLDVSRPTCRGAKNDTVRHNLLKQFATALGGDVRNFTFHRHECYNNINRFYLSNHTLHTGKQNKKDVCALEQQIFPERYDNHNITSLEDRMKGVTIVQASMSTEWECGEYVVVGGKDTRVAGYLNLDKYDTMPEMTVTEMPPNASLSVSTENFEKLKTFDCISGEYCRMMVSLAIGENEIGRTNRGTEGVLKVISKRKVELKKVLGAYFVGEQDFAQPIAVTIANATIFKMIRVRVLPNMKPEPSHQIELVVEKPSCKEVQDDFNHLMKNISVALHTPTTSLTVDSLSCKNNRTVLVFHKNTLAYSCDTKAIHEFSSKLIHDNNNTLNTSFMKKLASTFSVAEATLHYTGPCSSITLWITSAVPGSDALMKIVWLIASLFVCLIVVFGLFLWRGVASKTEKPHTEDSEITESETTSCDFPFVDADKESMRDPLEFGKLAKFFRRVDHNVKIHVV